VSSSAVENRGSEFKMNSIYAVTSIPAEKGNRAGLGVSDRMNFVAIK
jgi:hypothetical protein